MSANLSRVLHTRGFDVVKPLSIATMIAIMLPLILLPLGIWATVAVPVWLLTLTGVNPMQRERASR